MSTAELLQVIISSGTQGVPAAKIAKKIAELLDRSIRPTYQELLTVRGLGFAKASQIIAAFELGYRVNAQTDMPGQIVSEFLTIKHSSKRRLEYATVNGAGEYKGVKSEVIADMSRATAAIRKMFADGLHDYASSILVGIGSRTQQIEILDDDVLEIAKIIFETASLLEIKVNDIWIVNQTSQRSFRRKAVQ